MSIALERACARQPAAAEQPSCSGRPSPFHGDRVPAIPLADYIQRISRYSKCSNVCFVMALSYMQRLAQVAFLLHCPPASAKGSLTKGSSV